MNQEIVKPDGTYIVVFPQDGGTQTTLPEGAEDLAVMPKAVEVLYDPGYMGLYC